MKKKLKIRLKYSLQNLDEALTLLKTVTDEQPSQILIVEDVSLFSDCMIFLKSKLQSHFIHNILNNACDDVSVCQYAKELFNYTSNTSRIFDNYYSDNVFVFLFKDKKILIEKYDVGKYTVMFLNLKDQVHNENGPAFILTGASKKLEIWFKNGLIHNTNGPAVSFTNKNPKINLVAYFENNELKQQVQPSIVSSFGKKNSYIHTNFKTYLKYISEPSPNKINAFVKKESIKLNYNNKIFIDSDNLKKLYARKFKKVYESENGFIYMNRLGKHNDNGPAVKKIEYTESYEYNSSEKPNKKYFAQMDSDSLRNESSVKANTAEIQAFMINYKYFQNGLLHNSEGPASVCHYDDGALFEEYYYKGAYCGDQNTFNNKKWKKFVDLKNIF